MRKRGLRGTEQWWGRRMKGTERGELWTLGPVRVVVVVLSQPHVAQAGL